MKKRLLYVLILLVCIIGACGYFLNVSVVQPDIKRIEKYEENKFVGISLEIELDENEEKEIIFLMEYQKEDNKDTNYQNVGYYKEKFDK